MPALWSVGPGGVAALRTLECLWIMFFLQAVLAPPPTAWPTTLSGALAALP